LTNTTDLHYFLQTRQSIRRFKADPIPDSVIDIILTIATFAPSAHNRQPWRFCVLKDAIIKANLADVMAHDFQHDLENDNISPENVQTQVTRARDRFTSAPVAILLCLDMTEMDVYPDEKRKQAEYLMTVQSVANAGMQLLLAAHAEGLGAVWVCSPLFAQQTIQDTLSLPNTWEPQAMIYLGYPASIPNKRERKPLKDITLRF